MINEGFPRGGKKTTKNEDKRSKSSSYEAADGQSVVSQYISIFLIKPNKINIFRERKEKIKILQNIKRTIL
jgi:hypothetical protein